MDERTGIQCKHVDKIHRHWSWHETRYFHKRLTLIQYLSSVASNSTVHFTFDSQHHASIQEVWPQLENQGCFTYINPVPFGESRNYNVFMFKFLGQYFCYSSTLSLEPPYIHSPGSALSWMQQGKEFVLSKFLVIIITLLTLLLSLSSFCSSLLSFLQLLLWCYSWYLLWIFLILVHFLTVWILLMSLYFYNRCESHQECVMTWDCIQMF